MGYPFRLEDLYSHRPRAPSWPRASSGLVEASSGLVEASYGLEEASYGLVEVSYYYV